MTNQQNNELQNQNGTEPVATEPNGNATIESQAQTGSAGDSTPEDTLKAYQGLFEQQNKQIASLLETNKSLQNQIGILIRNGAHPNATRLDSGSSVSGNGNPSNAGIGPDMGQTEPQEPYVSLTELGSEIGKRDYHSHNMEPDKD